MSELTWTEVLKKLLEKNILIEDPSTGIIQIQPEYYLKLNKNIPGTVKTQIPGIDLLVKQYIDLWPKKILSGGRPVRQGPTPITKKLTVFIKKHPKVTFEQILNATNRYLATMKSKDWAYMTCSDYFISKNESSVLESYLEDKDLGNKEISETPKVSLNQRFI